MPYRLGHQCFITYILCVNIINLLGHMVGDTRNTLIGVLSMGKMGPTMTHKWELTCEADQRH